LRNAARLVRLLDCLGIQGAPLIVWAIVETQRVVDRRLDSVQATRDEQDLTVARTMHVVAHREVGRV
jgi:hypothetical protein